MKKHFLYTILVLFLSLDVASQSHPSLSNYLFNPVSISPSYAGRLSGTISAGHDQRWVGIDGKSGWRDNREGGGFVDGVEHEA